jgi:hypothetical protein
MLFATVLMAGCAAPTDNAQAPQATRDEPVYRTGSNIPVRNATPLTAEEKERQAEAARSALRTSPTPGVNRN